MRCRFSISGTDSEQPWETISVCGIAFDRTSPGTVTGHSDSVTLDATQVSELIPVLAAVVLFRRLVALKFYLEPVQPSEGLTVGSNPNDIILRDNRIFRGLEASSDRGQDISLVRDTIILHVLAAGSESRAELLLGDATLIHALEEFIRAILYPDSLLHSLYKLIEGIQKRLGGRVEFRKIGLSKGYVDYVMERANRRQANERHAADDPRTVEPVGDDEKRTCLERCREVISGYAASIELASA
jgi:hypothetical protein